MLIEKEGARTTRRTRPTRGDKGERKAAAGDRGVETFPLVGPATTSQKMRFIPLNPPEREDGKETGRDQRKRNLTVGLHAWCGADHGKGKESRSAEEQEGACETEQEMRSPARWYGGGSLAGVRLILGPQSVEAAMMAVPGREGETMRT